MSLILDALKKSERERAQHDFPDLGADHAGFVATTGKRYRWFVIGAGVVLVNLGLWWWYGAANSMQQKPSLTPNPRMSTLPSKAKPSLHSAIPAVLKSKNLAKPRRAAHSDRARGSRRTTPKQVSGRLRERRSKPALKGLQRAAARASENRSRAVEHQVPKTTEPLLRSVGPGENNPISATTQAPATILEIPQFFRQRVPTLRFTSHVFTGNAATSFVVINNKMLTPGEEIGNGVKIYSITRFGVVLQAAGHSFRLRALRSWKP